MAAIYSGPVLLKQGANPIAEVTDLNLTRSANIIPTTPHKTTDRYEETITGIITASITCRLNFKRGEATHAALDTALTAGTLDAYSLVGGTADVFTASFSARVARMDLHFPPTAEQSADTELRISGAITWT